MTNILQKDDLLIMRLPKGDPLIWIVRDIQYAAIGTDNIVSIEPFGSRFPIKLFHEHVPLEIMLAAIAGGHITVLGKDNEDIAGNKAKNIWDEQ
jgi:hypothetical protein